MERSFAFSVWQVGFSSSGFGHGITSLVKPASYRRGPQNGRCRQIGEIECAAFGARSVSSRWRINDSARHNASETTDGCLAVASVIRTSDRRNPDYQLVHLTGCDGTDALCRDGFTRHVLSGQFGSFETAQHVHAEIAKMAAETIFSRNPDGFDDPERLERLFNPVTTAALNKDAARDAEVFRAQQIHQKIETGQIRELEVDNNTALVSVEGQILRAGVFNQRVVNDAKKVTVFLRLQVNDSMALNGRYPLVVVNYEERFE